MKHLFTLALTLTLSAFAVGQHVFDGNLQLGSQEEIDTVSSQYTVVTGKLQIFGANVKDLSPLANIDSVLGKFEILQTDSLETLKGLNVSYVGSNVYLEDNKALMSLVGLEKLTFIGKDLAIFSHDTLISLNGLHNLETITRNVYIGEKGWETPPSAAGNPNLGHFCALTTALNNGFSGDFFLNNCKINPSLSDLQSGACFEPVTFDGNIQIGSQAELDVLDPSITTVTGKLQIFGTDVSDLTNLSEVDSVLGKFEVLLTEELENFDGLTVSYVGNNVYIADNLSLKNVDGLSNLTSIGKDLVILENDSLENLDGFSALEFLARNVYIGEEGWNTPAVARPNPFLSNLCGLSGVIDASFSNDYFVNNNAYNPTATDFGNGNCSLSAGLFDSKYNANSIQITYERSEIFLQGDQEILEIIVFTVLGNEIKRLSPNSKIISLKRNGSGKIHIAHIVTKSGVSSQRLLF